MTGLLAAWPENSRRLTAAGRILLCLDYDGTLSPIVRDPAAARISASTRKLLQRLSASDRITVAVISGRQLEDVRRLVGLPDLIYAGNHGLEIRGPSVTYLNPVAAKSRPALRALARKLIRELTSYPGAQIEDKGLTLSIHYRRVRPTDRDRVKEAIFRAAAPYRSGRALRLGEGKMVIEIRPPTSWNKGNAVRLLQRKNSRGGDLLTVYLGDDRTDEDAFRAVGREGITVKVGPPGTKTLARYRLAGVGEVREFLRCLSRLPADGR